MKHLLEEIRQHGLASIPKEACGVVVLKKGREVYIPCNNIAEGTNDFIIDPSDIVKAEEMGEITYIVHSHPYSKAEPSQTDLFSIEKTNIPWVIMNPGSGEYTTNYPCNYKPPLIGREFKHGLVDCYTLVQDYYFEKGIKLGNYIRPDDWWSKTNLNFYMDYYEAEGFEKVLDGSIQEHDLLFMRVGSSKENHAAIYIGNNMILHHPMNRLSSRDIYGGWWQKITTMVVRHKDLK
jgi:proteasome lid subunit RPN8/RPN11